LSHRIACRHLAALWDARERISNPIHRSPETIDEAEMTVVYRIEGPGQRQPPAKIVEMTAESPHEVRTVSAVRQVMFRLTALLTVRKARRVALQDGLAIRAPLASLESPETIGEVVDPPGYFLPIRPRRQALDELTDLSGLEAPSVSEHQHGPPAPRE
jgi:hypothetical protein